MAVSRHRNLEQPPYIYIYEGGGLTKYIYIYIYIDISSKHAGNLGFGDHRLPATRKCDRTRRTASFLLAAGLDHSPGKCDAGEMLTKSSPPECWCCMSCSNTGFYNLPRHCGMAMVVWLVARLLGFVQFPSSRPEGADERKCLCPCGEANR